MKHQYYTGQAVLWHSQSQKKIYHGVVVKILDENLGLVNWGHKGETLTPLWSSKLEPDVLNCVPFDDWCDSSSMVNFL